jgi:radical SAM superfamily enzyme YgiQ (UPF0313 family)
VARALLINPSYFRTYGSNEGGLAFPVFPVLGLASIAGAVRDRGHDVRILDLSYRQYEPDLLREVLAEERPDVVAVTATTPLMNQARDISFLVREHLPEALSIVGGAHASALPAETVRESAFDLAACGEADWVVADLLDGIDPATMPGIWRRTSDGVAGPLEPATPIGDLDLLPMPCWEHYPMDGNRRITKLTARHLPVTVTEFSRGCIYGCDFCASKNTMGRGYRKKSPERCAEELARTASLGFREIVVVDDIFTTDQNWAAAVCEEIIRTGVDIAWTCSNGIRVDSADPELFALMRRAGCYRVSFGFESGSEEVLKAFRKGGRASIDKGIRAVELATRAGLEANGFFLVGLTGETEATLDATIDYARRLPLQAMKCGICIPFPGTPMFRELHQAGRIKTLDWDQYTVYNRAERIFEHPTVPWETVRSAFNRFYARALVRNPRYLARRLRYSIRNHELFWHLFYALKFWKLIWGRQTREVTEHYAYEAQWRPLDTPLDGELSSVPVQVVRRRGTALAGVGRRPDERPRAGSATQA